MQRNKIKDLLMTRAGILLGIMFMAAVPWLFPGLDRDAAAQSTPGKWAVGVRGGAAFFHQDVTEDLSGKTGPIIGGDVLYRFTDIFSLGLDVEWERHNFEVLGLDAGYSTTVSIIPFVEIHPVGTKAILPYASLGVGLNVNAFHPHPPVTVLTDNLPPQLIVAISQLSLDKVDLDNTPAIKISAGVDLFATQRVAVNTEIGWKRNSGNGEFCNPFGGCKNDNWKADTYTVLMGLRYYFH
ncbi:MAG TPA: hypothetical protein VFG95_08855 [Nitrospiria bacterium]|nr:hypothetical protein [Nitrospiria bacterium]